MYSLHLTGNPWFLLLLPPGLYILWRQYRGGRSASAPRAGLLLFGLQAAALALLTISLTAPELRSHRVEFHNPAILILRDQSASFRGGAYLGLGGRYSAMEKVLVDRYAARKFDVRIVDFAESAWPVSGFPRAGRRPEAGRRGSVGTGYGEGLTDLSALADFVDSAAVPNLQAAFLFSDGRSNLDSGRGSRSWRIPLYPVVFAPDSIAELQPVQVTIREVGGATGSGGGAAFSHGAQATEVVAAWRTVGRKGPATEILILQGGKTLLSRKTPVDASTLATTPEGEASGFRFSWTPERSVMDGREPLRAVVRPADGAGNFDPFNDTVDVFLPRGRSGRVLYVLRPVRSLDEKGMLDILGVDEGTRLAFFGKGDLARMDVTARDQVWVEAGSLAEGGALPAWLAGTPAKVVVYAGAGRARNLQVAGLDRTAWRKFSPAAEIRAGNAASDAFPDEVVRLKGITSAGLEAPAPSGEPWVELVEGGHRAMLMGRIPLAKGKRAFFFCLPAIWGSLFDPEGDFATRENIGAYLRGARAMADREDGAVRVSVPGRVFQGVPFEVEADVSLPDGTEKSASKPLVFVADGPGFSREWPLAEGDGRSGRIKGISLETGVFSIGLRTGDETLWRDSLRVEPAEALELARIGYDMESLDDAAVRSGGKIVRAPGDSADRSWVSSELPEPAAAQIRSVRIGATPLYNTPAQFLLVILLLSLSWALRKKWDID